MPQSKPCPLREDIDKERLLDFLLRYATTQTKCRRADQSYRGQYDAYRPRLWLRADDHDLPAQHDDDD